MSKLKGVIPALPTPLLENEDIDVDGLCRLLDHVVKEGASGVFVLGNMGEGPALLDSQKKVAVKTAVEHINGKVPVLASIAEVSPRRMLELGGALSELGPDYLVVTTPFYYEFPHPDSIIESVSRLCKELDKPLVFYHCPGATGNKVDLETVDTIINMPEVAALKDSSCDIHLVMELLRRYPDKQNRPCSIFQGDEFIYDLSLLMGADGVITGGGSAFVSDLVALYDAALRGDAGEAFKLQQKFRKNMDDMLGPELGIDWMHAIKKELKKKGLCEAKCTCPFLERM